MYNQPFFIPGMAPSMMGVPISRGMMGMAPHLGRLGTMGAVNGAARGSGLIGRLGSSIAGLRSFNWSGLINGTSKTLGVINQPIPLVKQVGPVMNNMKSMLRVASAFKDETDGSSRRRRNFSPQRSENNNTSVNFSRQQNSSYERKKEKVEYSNQVDYSPTFFIQS